MAGKQKTFDASTDALHPDFVRFVVENYHNDFNAYRVDILGMASEPWQNLVGDDLQKYRRVAVQSGHGIGKTGLAAAAIHWFLATRPNPAINATANTEVQLSTKLWRELAKINKQARNSDWFEWSATRFSLRGDATAFAAAIPWNENNPESFAGTHEKHVLGVFDEASSIPSIIWTTFSGAMSTDGARWLALGNPTLNTGFFHDICNGKMKWRHPGDERMGKWKAHIVGSPDSSFVSSEWVEEQKTVLGEDSDDYRVRVLGLPPREAADQFISPTLIDHANNLTVEPYERHPLVLGVDVARQGAHKVAEEIHFYREDEGLEVRAVFIEGGGSIGWGVIEELWELGYEQVQDVNPGSRASEPERFVNKRCEMWGLMKEWLQTEAVHIPVNNELYDDLIGPKTKPDAALRLRLESKDEMRRRGIRSPDFGDSLALTFASPVELERDTSKDRYSDFETSAETSGDDWMIS
jgi:hypothetical protein